MKDYLYKLNENIKRNNLDITIVGQFRKQNRSKTKTYLIKCEHKSEIKMENGIYVPINFDVDEIEDIFYKGEVIAHGTGFSDEEIKELVQIGKTVVFEYKEKRRTKMTIGKTTYYIKDEDQILGVIEDEEC